MKIFSGKISRAGSLQLSINAIVVLILAITLLGLGLGFIKKQFGTVSAKFDEASQDIETEMINKLKSSGDLLAFDKMRIVTERGKPFNFYVGIKNTDSGGELRKSSCFQLKFYCKQALSDPDYPVGEGENNVANGWFSTFETITIDPLDVEVVPVKLQLSSTPSDTYNMKIELLQNPQCSGSFEPLTSKQFFLEVK